MYSRAFIIWKDQNGAESFDLTLFEFISHSPSVHIIVYTRPVVLRVTFYRRIFVMQMMSSVCSVHTQYRNDDGRRTANPAMAMISPRKLVNFGCGDNNILTRQRVILLRAQTSAMTKHASEYSVTERPNPILDTSAILYVIGRYFFMCLYFNFFVWLYTTREFNVICLFRTNIYILHDRIS